MVTDLKIPLKDLLKQTAPLPFEVRTQAKLPSFIEANNPGEGYAREALGEDYPDIKILKAH